LVIDAVPVLTDTGKKLISDWPAAEVLVDVGNAILPENLHTALVTVAEAFGVLGPTVKSPVPATPPHLTENEIV
jgi:hypothetical protein